jgi:hypothetical protein
MRWPIRIAVSLPLLIWVAMPLHGQPRDGERTIRNVTPENIPVIILPPRPKGDGKQKADEPPIPGDGVVATVSEDGIVLAGGKILKFLGTVNIPSDTLCESANGGRWACGLRAYVALRNLIHGKEIKCEALHVRGEATVSRCFRDPTNISDWLIAEGWAFYDDSVRDEALSNSAEDARKNGRGIWANSSQPVKR